jgi:hypothetical protein
MRSTPLQTDRPHRDDIEAAVAAYTAAGQRPLLTPKAVHLLSVMFADADVCRRNLESLMAEGFSRDTLLPLLKRLEVAGFLLKQRGAGRTPNTYRLHLLPWRQP